MSFHFVAVVVSVFVLYNRGSNSQTFTIRRFPGKNFNINDSFDVTPATSLSQAPCSDYGGSNVRNKPWRCVCNLSNKQTFGFFNNKWQCYDNSVITSSQGCNAKMYNSGPPAINIIKTGEQYFWSDKVWPNECNLDVPQTRYLSCNGTWLPQVNADITFNIWKTDNGYCTLLVHKLDNDSRGRLIKVGVRCHSSNNGGGSFTTVDCLMVKLAGTTTCQVATTAAPVTIATTSPLFPSSTSNNDTKNITSVRKPGGGSALTADDGSVGAIVGAVFAVLIVVVGAIVTVLVLKRKGKLGFRRRKSDQVGEQLTENPSYGSIINPQFPGDNAEKETDPQSPLYAVVGKRDSKRQKRERKNSGDDSSNGATSGTEYPDYARVTKNQTPRKRSQSETYDYACAEGPAAGRCTKVHTGHIENCPVHSSKINIARSFSSDSDNYETLAMAMDNGRCKVPRDDNNSIYDVPEMPIVDEPEGQRGDRVVGGGATSQKCEDNDGYEVPVECSTVDKRRAFFELRMSKASDTGNEKDEKPFSSTENRTETNDENPHQDFYSVLEGETPEKEHVYQALRDSCDVYEPLQTLDALQPSSPTRPLSLEHEFDETPI